MSGNVARWPVRQDHPVTAGGLNASGMVSAEAVEHWVSAARAYLSRCDRLWEAAEREALDVQHHISVVPPGCCCGLAWRNRAGRQCGLEPPAD